jgi:hypothetical protein
MLKKRKNQRYCRNGSVSYTGVNTVYESSWSQHALRTDSSEIGGVLVDLVARVGRGVRERGEKKEVASQRWQKDNPQGCDSCIHRDSNGNPHALTGCTR